VNRNLNLIENKEYLNELSNNKKTYLVTDEEWNKIYLQELTQTSNVQDIIFEVNSNKPGGINNPIKGNKTVPKNIIKKPNDTKRMLVNIQKEQVGAVDTYKFSPNLKSVSGLKTKISQMNEEEKKLKNNSIKKSPQPNIKKNNLNIKDGAPFETFLPKVTDILQRLEQNLPQYKLNGYKNIWIMKPSNLSRGRGVTCVDSLQPIEQSLTATNDSGLIVQKYIENPLIIKKRKFDIRQWVLVTSLNPLVIWMWKEPYLRFGAEDYIMDDLNNIYSHLTNNSIAKHSEQFKNEKNFEGDMWTCQDFIRENEVDETF
jgi:tubulin monoglycylase TTLL3/8